MNRPLVNGLVSFLVAAMIWMVHSQLMIERKIARMEAELDVLTQGITRALQNDDVIQHRVTSYLNEQEP